MSYIPKFTCQNSFRSGVFRQIQNYSPIFDTLHFIHLIDIISSNFVGWIEFFSNLFEHKQSVTNICSSKIPLSNRRRTVSLSCHTNPDFPFVLNSEEDIQNLRVIDMFDDASGRRSLYPTPPCVTTPIHHNEEPIPTSVNWIFRRVYFKLDSNFVGWTKREFQRGLERDAEGSFLHR